MIQTIQTIWNLVKGRAPEAPLTVDETHAALELVAEGAGNAGGASLASGRESFHLGRMSEFLHGDQIAG